MKRTSLLIAAVGATALVLAGCSSNDSTTDSASSSTQASAKSTTKSAPLDMSQFEQLPAVPAPAGATVDCTYAPAAGAAKTVDTPTSTGVPAEGTVNVQLTTTAGPIGMELNRTAAPCTVNSMVSLVEQKYFDDTPCHRLVTSPGLQILQCGDPSGQGTGGPGFGFANEYPTTVYAENDPALSLPVVYPRGTLAMAHSSQPDSNGSQFFLVYDDSLLPPDYTVFGTIDEAGLATIEKIAADGDDGSMGATGGGAPNTPITIETAVVA
ncbi:peptidylprolyl isomerase [Rhodococcus sp. ACPA4]|jgi:peptidyl-prolyl cis-trans isomerase B (cyclophilin B)|uniref:peptidylprolyl isomerase n=1 Tax=Rhodococcus TaxID=1827 RepID=UPI0005D3BEE0|nr:MULTISPECIES: peptidylprolyl isomerase [Rhodococcus]KJF22499.1 Peptidyl-prolyl cis-trans isomerase B [Rhodococcus sp. AD45]MCE4268172.1 peptidylprolyl isomerase [Rhodococcus globerulus]NRI64307.1 peptidylprolyl isomerase [Rhodococcus sp. MS16]PBC40884.1 peptidylprolyl isomerase [Rhodococcus sp. ACPA4]PSR40117.1 peptidylprolyl isomerase [Rhodococcus sp. AD45-ID]